jgi:hypothetical protein
MPPASVAIHNARVYPLTRGLDRVDAISWVEDRIVSVGPWSEVEKTCGAHTEVIDGNGLTVLPGFTDSHAHLDSLGRMLTDINLSGVHSFDELLVKISDRVKKAKPGEWVIGRGWDHTLWPSRAFPSHEKLSQLAPQNPVWLYRRDGHSGLANAAALTAAKITAATPNPPGGEIVRHPTTQEPTGILIDLAMNLMDKVIPPARVEHFQRWLLNAQEECIKHGLTSVHDAGVTATYLEAVKAMVRQGLQKIRIYGMYYHPNLDEMEKYIQQNTPYQNYGKGNVLSVRALKFYMDGSLGSRSAWMFNPYFDRPTDDQGRPYCGLPFISAERLTSLAAAAIKKGFQVCVHAIGDRANHETLNALHEAISNSEPGDYRPRIEHVQFIRPADIPRFGILRIIPSVQPSHAIADRKTVPERLGKESFDGAYPWKSLLKSNARMIAGSDFPFERVSPLWTYYCAVTRQDSTGQPKDGWMPQERLSPLEAIRAITTDPAYAAFEENERGTLAPGKFADITLLSDDILAGDIRSVLRTEVAGTIIGGTFYYRNF